LPLILLALPVIRGASHLGAGLVKVVLCWPHLVRNHLRVIKIHQGIPSSLREFLQDVGLFWMRVLEAQTDSDALQLLVKGLERLLDMPSFELDPWGMTTLCDDPFAGCLTACPLDNDQVLFDYTSRLCTFTRSATCSISVVLSEETEHLLRTPFTFDAYRDHMHSLLKRIPFWVTLPSACSPSFPPPPAWIPFVCVGAAFHRRPWVTGLHRQSFSPVLGTPVSWASDAPR
jgi:hypothetical protein